MGLTKVLEDHGRHSMLSFLSSLPISVLNIVDTEANNFYDRNHQLYDAALLTRCYTQHALRPFIDRTRQLDRNEFAWHASGPEFDPHGRHILSWRLGQENISTAILPLPLIQEEQLSVTGERMCTKYW